MNHVLANQATLIMAIVDNRAGRTIVEAIRQAGAPGCTKMSGDGFIVSGKRSKVLWMEQDLLLSLIAPPQAETIINAMKQSATKNKISAVAMLINAADINNAVIARGANAPAGQSADTEEPMQLIVTIASHGLTDEIMFAARQAGARGGTVINARGTGTEEDAKFFGVSLAPEKEMLLILADKTESPRILEAINSQPALSEPGAGIVFTINVTQSFFMNTPQR